MSRHLSPQSSLDTLKREAKRWLKAIRAGDPQARGRFARAISNDLPNPTLRDVQHALARELGCTGWPALKAALATRDAPPDTAEHSAVVGALLEAAARGDARAVSAVLDAHPDIVSERGELAGHTGRRSA